MVVSVQDAERLETESKRVDHALLGLKVVVDGGWCHMLHGSATVVLEAVMEFTQLVESLVADHDRCVRMRMRVRVCRYGRGAGASL